MTLVPQADVIVLAVPATTHTYHLVDETFLAAMRSNALLVNVSRGSVVSTTALLEQVQSGRLRAALDVTDPEPLPPDHPLWRTEGVIITPHVGGGVPELCREHVRWCSVSCSTGLRARRWRTSSSTGARESTRVGADPAVHPAVHPTVSSPRLGAALFIAAHRRRALRDARSG